MRPRWALILTLTLLAGRCALADSTPAHYVAMLKALGRSGDFKDGVLKIDLPRTDLKVAVDGQPMPTGFGFSGWVAITAVLPGNGDRHAVMGQLVLTEAETGPMIAALLAQGFDITGLHSHFFNERPRVFYLHLRGVGTAAQLVQRLRAPLALVPSSTGPAVGSGLDGKKIQAIVKHAGEDFGGVHKVTVNRRDFFMQDQGAILNARMGFDAWAAFHGTDAQATVAGAVAVLEGEIRPVLTALRTHGLEVGAIDHCFAAVHPQIITIHFRGRGSTEQLARGFRAALDALAKIVPRRW